MDDKSTLVQTMVDQDLWCYVFSLNSMDEDADVQCRTCLERAVEKDPENPEAYQLFASYWLSKEDKQVRFVNSLIPGESV